MPALVKAGKFRSEQMFSGSPPKADLRSARKPEDMVRPCVARGFVDLADVVLHQCIRPLIGAGAPGHHGYQRACDLISGQASNGPNGSPVFGCAGKTDPRLVLSQTWVG